MKNVSSIILPKLEVTKSTAAFISLVFSSLLLLFSYLGELPNLISSSTLFGMIFITLIIGSTIVSLIGTAWMGWLQEFIIPNEKSIWFRSQLKRIRKTKEYKELRDAPIAQAFLGITIWIIAWLTFQEKNNLLYSLTNITIHNNNSIFNMISIILFIVGLVLIMKSVLDTKYQRHSLLEIIWLRNIRITEGKKRDELLSKFNNYLTTHDWEGLHNEFKSSLIKPMLREIARYSEALGNVKNVLNHRILFEPDKMQDVVTGFAGFFDGFANQPNSGTHWIDFNQRAYSPFTTLKSPLKIKDLSISQVIFGIRKEEWSSELYGTDLGIEKIADSIEEIRIIDSIIVNFSSFLLITSLMKKNQFKSEYDMILSPRLSEKKIKLDLEQKVNSHEIFLLSIAIGAFLLSNYDEYPFLILDNRNIHTAKINLSWISKLINEEKSSVVVWDAINFRDFNAETWLESVETALSIYIRRIEDQYIMPVKNTTLIVLKRLLKNLRTKNFSNHIKLIKEQRLNIIKQLKEDYKTSGSVIINLVC